MHRNNLCPERSGWQRPCLPLVCVLLLLMVAACERDEASETLRALNSPELNITEPEESGADTRDEHDAGAQQTLAGALPEAENETRYTYLWPPPPAWPVTEGEGEASTTGAPEDGAEALVQAPEGEAILLVVPVWGESQEPGAHDDAEYGWLVVTIPQSAASASSLGAALPSLRNGRLSTFFYPRDPTTGADVDREGSIDPIDEIETITVAWGLASPDEELLRQSTGGRVNDNRLFEVCLPTEWRVNTRGERIFGHRCVTFLRDATHFSRLESGEVAVSARGEAATLEASSARAHFRWTAPDDAAGVDGPQAPLQRVVQSSVSGPGGETWSCAAALEWQVIDARYATPLSWQDTSLARGLRGWLERGPVASNEPSRQGDTPNNGSVAIEARHVVCALKLLRSEGGGLTSRSEDFAALEEEALSRLIDTYSELSSLDTWTLWGWLAALHSELNAASGGVLPAADPNALLSTDGEPHWRQIPWRATGYTLAQGASVAWQTNELLTVPTSRGVRSCDTIRCEIAGDTDDEGPVTRFADDPGGRVRFVGASRDAGGGVSVYLTSLASGRTCERTSFCDVLRACDEVSYGTLRNPYSLLGPSFSRLQLSGERAALLIGDAATRAGGSVNGEEGAQSCVAVDEWALDGFDGWIDARTLRFVRADGVRVALDAYTGIPRTLDEAAEDAPTEGGDRAPLMQSAGTTWSLWSAGAERQLLRTTALDAPEVGYGANILLGARAVPSPDGSRVALQLGNRLLGVWERVESSNPVSAGSSSEGSTGDVTPGAQAPPSSAAE